MILVTGGTGVLGRVVVRRLLAAGHEVRVMSRRPRSGDASSVVADLGTGDGLEAAVADVEVIVHLASSAISPGKELAGAQRLVAAATKAGAPHVVYSSIVGVDRVPIGYYGAKLAVEGLLERSALPHTIQRATQFHDLIRTMLAGAAKLPVLLVPSLRFQSIDVRDVAERMVELALDNPAGRAPDLGGPQVRHTRDLARAYLSATGRRRAVVPIPLPGKAFRAYREGGNLTPEHADGKVTFEEYLADYPEPRHVSYRGKP